MSRCDICCFSVNAVHYWQCSQLLIVKATTKLTCCSVFALTHQKELFKHLSFIELLNLAPLCE